MKRDVTRPAILVVSATDRELWKKENSDTRKLRKKFRAPGENRNHYPPSTSSEALNTELLEALWRAGLKFN